MTHDQLIDALKARFPKDAATVDRWRPQFELVPAGLRLQEGLNRLLAAWNKVRAPLPNDLLAYIPRKPDDEATGPKTFEAEDGKHYVLPFKPKFDPEFHWRYPETVRPHWRDIPAQHLTRAEFSLYLAGA